MLLSLMMLNLSKNQLPVIDLVPLRTCTELSELNLGDNRLRYIDLSPLRNCPQLENIRLYRNYLKEETIVRICSEPGPIDSSVHIVVADSAAIEMTVTTSSKVIDISRLAECRQLIELTIQQCKNLETIRNFRSSRLSIMVHLRNLSYRQGVRILKAS